ncbi:trehalose biosynthesis protein [Brachybacterium sp. GCM10030267]|uniref:maltokinase N-terminal cap-like domain-containing protein n=1 Tax=unclassified Brachybacterium TaxID=2623841 RepID=UPI003611FB51
MDEPSSPPAADGAAAAGASPSGAAFASGTPFDVTTLPPLDDVLNALTGPLAAWMPSQRWYAHKGAGTPTVSIRGWAPLRVAAGHAVVLTVVAAAPEGAGEALYQVPLVLRPPDGPGAARDEGSEIGVVAVPGGPVRADDATLDADGRAAIVAALAAGDGALGSSLSMAAHPVGHPAGRPLPLPRGAGLRTRLLSGEQSNTSMIAEAEGADPVIIKLFRVLQHGENPDVVLQGALSAAGSTRVPSLVASATVRVGPLRTHALFAQEFLPGLEDAWRTALRLARAGEDFTAAARALGSTLAEVHHDLAVAFGATATDHTVATAMLEQMRRRVGEIAEAVPQVAGHRDALESLLASAGEVDWPAMQRIHGDLHLGQVLLAPGRGWVLLDFEGEPLRPLEQRGRPDSPLRDVAGMLRSLDYVAGAVAHEDGADASLWAAHARDAFLDGYAGTSGLPLHDPALQVLLAAFEADKAAYEALYESRNRPDWLPIPLAALERISARAGEPGSPG